jgi:hypothetical protein
LHYKIIGAPKKFKNQPRPLVRPSSLNFSQNFWNLSHETVPLNNFFFLQPNDLRIRNQNYMTILICSCGNYVYTVRGEKYTSQIFLRIFTQDLHKNIWWVTYYQSPHKPETLIFCHFMDNYFMLIMMLGSIQTIFFISRNI